MSGQAVQGSPRLARTLASYVPAYVAPAIMGVAATPVLTRALGPHEFGIYAVCLSIHGLLLMLGADPTTGALRRLYAPAAMNAEAGRLMRALFGLAAALTVGVAVTALGIAVVVVAGLHLEGWFAPLAATIAMTAGFTLFQYLLTTLYVQERVRATASLQVGHSVTKALGLVAGGLIAGTAFGALIGYFAVLVVLVAWQYRGLRRYQFPFVDRVRWRTALGYGMPLIVVSMSFVMLAGFDRIALAVLGSESAAGKYAVTYLLSDAIVSLPAMAVHYAVYPPLVGLWERGEKEQARDLLTRAVDIFLVFGATVVTALALVGPEVTRLFGGEGYHVPDTVPVLVAFGLLLYRLSYFESIAFELTLNTRGLAGTFGAAAILCLPVTVICIEIGGVAGAAVSTALSYFLFCVLVRLRNPMRSVTAYPMRRLIPIGISACALVLAAYQLPHSAGLALIVVVQPLVAAGVLGRLPLRRIASLVARRRPPRPAVLGGLSLALLVLALSAIVFAGGAAWVALASVALIGAWLILPRPALLIACLAAAGFVASSLAPLAGTSVSLATVGTPARNALILALVAQAAVFAYRAGGPFFRLLLPVAPLLVVIGFSIALAPAMPENALLALPFGAMVAGSALMGWHITSSDKRLGNVVNGLAYAYGALLVANVVLLPFVSQPAFLPTADGPRFEGILENPNTVGMLGFSAVPMLICSGLMRPRGSLARTAFLGLAALGVLEVVLSLSRAGLAGLVVGLGIVALGTTRGRPAARAVLVMLMIVVVGFAAATGGTSTVSEHLRLNTVQEGSGRVDVAARAIDSVSARPLIGYGYGSEQELIRSYGQIGSFTGDYAGNVVIDLMLEVGLIGLIAFALAVGIPLVRARAAMAAPASRWRRLAILAFVAAAAGGLADAQGESILMRPGAPVAPLFWLALGVCSAEALRAYRARRREHAAPA